MCTIVCNLQRLKNGLEFNGSEGLVSSMNHIPNDYFDLIIAYKGWE